MDVLTVVLCFCCGACSDRSVKRTPEWLDLKADLTWWAAHRPEVRPARQR